MAIVKMNKFTLLAFESQKEELIRRLQGFSSVEFVDLQDEELLEKYEELKSLSKDDIDSECAKYEENLSKAKSAVNFLTNYVPKKSGLKALEDDKESLSLDELESQVEKSDWLAVYDKVKEKEDELASLHAKIAKLEGEIEILTPWQSLDTSFESLNELKMTYCILGTIQKEYEQTLVESLDDVYLEIISRDNNDVNVLILANLEDKEKISEVLRGLGFSYFKTESKHVPMKSITDFKAEIEELKSKEFFVKQELLDFKSELKTLQLVYDYYTSKIQRKTVSKNFLKTDTIVTIQGWNCKEENDKLVSICKDVLGDDYYLNFEEVKDEEIDDVPIKLKNGKMTSAFVQVTEMYSYPKYNEVDPTPLLAPFYLIFFGMMVADAGYGLLVMLGSIFALKGLNLDKSKRDFARFFFYLSIPTIAFGLIYGSFFGDMLPLPKLVDPSRDVNTILILSIILGVIQIFFGLGIKAYTLIKLGKPLDAFYDVGAWVITLVSIGLLVLAPMFGLPAIVGTISKFAMIFGMIVIILTGGRAEKSKGAQLGQGLYALYGITGYVGDLVSYTRLMALGLAGGSIAGALNLLIGSLPGVAVWIVGPVFFILAHIFNLLLSLLGAYVHTARLQYVEYFSKFYDGGGKPFEPFTASDKYINLKRN